MNAHSAGFLAWISNSYRLICKHYSRRTAQFWARAQFEYGE